MESAVKGFISSDIALSEVIADNEVARSDERFDEAGSVLGSECGNPQLSLICKRAMDVVGSSMLIVFLFPPFLLIVAILFLYQGSPIFQHERIGKGGRPFRCYKFRTMIPNAEQKLMEVLANDPELRDEWERTQKLASDPRVTRFGKFLRKTSLDELPQLFNVLKGDMSLVGPRPVLLSEIERYGRSARWYLAVRPGMTGLWQVARAHGTDYFRRAAMDTYYVRNQSLFLDFAILLRTFSAVIQKCES
jgi:undecaprenyl-phosphate galactose phosphotransferase